MIFRIVIVTLLASGLQTGSGQDPKEVPSKSEVFDKLAGAIKMSNLENAVVATAADDKELFVKVWGRMKESLTTLQGLARDRDVSVEYRRSLADDADLLESLKKADLTVDQKLDVCKNVATDLESKAKYSIDRMKKDKDPFAPVKVVAHTKDGEQEISGFDVCYAATSWSADRKREFKKASSPTTEPLAPGEYVFWSKKGRAQGEKKTVLIGNTGNDSEDVDLAVPGK